MYIRFVYNILIASTVIEIIFTANGILTLDFSRIKKNNDRFEKITFSNIEAIRFPILKRLTSG